MPARVQFKPRLPKAEFASLLALVMVIADLSGRAKVVAEVSAAGVKSRPKISAAFAGERGSGFGWRDSGGGNGVDAAARRARFETRDPEPETRNPVFPFTDAEILAPERVTPTAALEFFKQRIGMTRQAYDKLQAKYREVAFTVANVESVRVIETIQGVLSEAIETGQTRDWFRARVNEEVRRAGISPLNRFHIETVFENAVNSAYQTGRAHQMLQADVRKALPFWRYRTVGDSRVRPAHRALHDFVARHDDPVWRRIYPPNGHRCRCSVVAILREEAMESGQDFSRTGLQRLPAQPDEGFDWSPVIQFEKRLSGEAKFWERRCA